MKLKNKKTGKIVDFKTPLCMCDDKSSWQYNSLSELEEDWEDAPEEPKGGTMRSLKFRAWVNDHWLDWIPTCKTLGAYNASAIDTDGYTFEEDDPFIVEQYTGLKDKNGKEIYEGDIILISFENEKEIAKVLWLDDQAMFGLKWLDCGTSDELGYWIVCKGSVGVIGNIHENPELLGGEE